MQANTKLTPEQKAIFKELREVMENKNVRVVNLDNKTTMAFLPKGNTVEFALSVMAPTEKKFRRKVGEFYAMQKFYNGETVKMSEFDFAVMCECVWDAYLF